MVAVVPWAEFCRLIEPFYSNAGTGRRLFETVHEHLERRAIKVDATIIGAPSSTKTGTCARDIDICQTRKTNHWYFGMKAHLGVSSAIKVTYHYGGNRYCRHCGVVDDVERAKNAPRLSRHDTRRVALGLV